MKNNETASQTPTQWNPKNSKKTTALFIITIVISVLVVLYTWRLPPFGMHSVHTNNAYVRGKITLLSPKVSGYVQEVLVQDFAQVKQGQPLVSIDSTPYQAKVAQAKANLKVQEAALAHLPQTRNSAQSTLTSRQAAIENAKAQLARASTEMQRLNTLVKTESASKRERDQAIANLTQAQANLVQSEAQYQIAKQDIINLDADEKSLIGAVENAKATLELAQQELDNCTIFAPESGKLNEIGVKNGQFVSSGSQLMYLVPHQRWIIANFKETDIKSIKVGQKATISVDALDGQKFQGKVTDIAPATGAEFSVIRADSGSGNFVKIAQRIAVKIILESPQSDLERLSPGMSVEVEINF
ncbi:HlyD family secretion protein [Rodentibacter caecimuris]|uniref:Secretion protein HlyD n=1 Tax=Rodentibacter caecimuris TaxID=1796644 RepID=A0ABX3L2U1_9PAST|nr:secretion protein HlyD [Rodentibacter heylii]